MNQLEQVITLFLCVRPDIYFKLRSKTIEGFMSIENTEGGGLLLLGSRILNAVRFKLSGEASVQSSVVLCVRRPFFGLGRPPRRWVDVISPNA